MKSEKHRPSRLKQQNKPHKHGRHRSKSHIDRELHGRVNVKTMTKRVKAAENRQTRRNQAKQLRSLKMEKTLELKRRIGGQYSPPHFVVVLRLCESADCQAAVGLLAESVMEMEGFVANNEQGIVHTCLPNFKKRLSFYCPPSDSLRAVLDAAKIADSLLLVMCPDDEIDDRSEFSLKCLMAQGVPNVVFAVQGLRDMSHKRLTEARKCILRRLGVQFPGQENKILAIDVKLDAAVILRKLTNTTLKPMHLRDDRCHMIAEHVTFEADDEKATEGTLKLSGYLRGDDLCADRLVYVVGWGTYQVGQVDLTDDPYPLLLHKAKANDMEVGRTVEVLATPHSDRQVSLKAEFDVDLMAAEQTWPTDEEIQEAKVERQDADKEQVWRKILASQGVSDYQSTWFFDNDLTELSREEGLPDDVDDRMDAGSLADTFTECNDDGTVDMLDTDSVSEADTNRGASYDTVSEMATTMGEENYDSNIDWEAEREAAQKMSMVRTKGKRCNPDIVDISEKDLLRERFARYRGLESFRTSLWDRNEELPEDYQRIVKVRNLRGLKRAILSCQVDNAVTAGQYVTVHVKAVPKAFMETYKPSTPLVMFGLLPLEQMMSVVHFVVRLTPDFNERLRSKSVLTVQAGVRRFSASAIFSSHRPGDKQLMYRYMPLGGPVVMSMYAPLCFDPCPVMVFWEDGEGRERLVGTGNLLSVNPDRLIIKRAVLTGEQCKIGKRRSVVRCMFYNREDIEYFKPVPIVTESKRRGRILMPLGTHGHMKVFLTGQNKSQDSAYMMLYKRVYPKWNYRPECPHNVDVLRRIEHECGMYSH